MLAVTLAIIFKVTRKISYSSQSRPLNFNLALRAPYCITDHDAVVELQYHIDVSNALHREILDDGSVRLSAGNAVFIFRRLRPGVLLVTISGDDRGQFGSSAIDEIVTEHIRFHEPMLLFFDLRKALGPTSDVMQTWTAWFESNRDNFRRIVLLVPPESKVLHLTVSIAQHLSRTGNLIRICGEIGEFNQAIAEQVPGVTPLA
jgi:hypothetical protein